MLFSTSNINATLNSSNSGKSCGADGLAAEYVMIAHRITPVFLFLLF